ncbi:hypothetical protein WA026_004681 [Henosepilachna vigintioctopunctata]|uniref:Uncharacterized protein n=1 Tax=Henosepilachna vigintioctopunctata TaxID=420089 RepID=A0AAW1V156_9CUCU
MNIVGIEKNLEPDEIVKCIQNQNEFFKQESEIHVQVIKKMKDRYLEIIQWDKQTHSDILEKGYLYIGFSPCSVYKHINLKRCYDCTGFYRIAKDCKKRRSVLNVEKRNMVLNVLQLKEVVQTVKK